MTTRARPSLGLSIVTVLFLLGATDVPAFAQAAAAFNGRITDETGGVLPGVTVNATQMSTRRLRSTITNAEGLYALPGLDPGVYEVRAELQGFAATLVKDVTLSVGATLTLDYILKPATVQETVTVSGGAPLIEVTKSELQSTLQTKELQALPMVNRNFAGLVALMPSARVGVPHDSTKQTIGGVSFGGSNGNNVNATVDGADNRDDYNGGLLMSYTLEGIDEFRLTTNHFSATDGRTNGASLAIVTKSGSNTVSGTGFLFGRDAAFAAKDYFAKTQNVAKAPLSRQQFGGSIGGPLVHNRIFYFGALERVREEAPITLTDGVMRELNVLTPFGANPQQRVDRPYRDLQYLGKVNLQLSEKSAAIVRWSQQSNSDTNHRGTITQYDQSFPQSAKNKFFNGMASLTTVFSPSVLNQVTVQYQYWRIDIDTSPAGIHPPATNNLTFPSVITGRNGGEFDQVEYIQFKDQFSVQRGSHALRLGADYVHYPRFTAGVSYGEDGGFTFFDDPSRILSDKARYPNGLQTPGIVQSWSGHTTAFDDASVLGAKQASTYVQDDWRVLSRLTLNLGVRYDVELNFLNNSQFDQSRTYQALLAIGSPYGRKPKTDLNNVSPRMGFAYRVGGSDRTVLRGGYGLYFDKPTAVTVYYQIPQMKQFIATTAILTNTAIGVGELATYRFGIDPPPLNPALTTALPPGRRNTGYWIDPDFRDPYNHQVHVGLSHQLSSNVGLSVDAIDSRGHNEFRQRDINYIGPSGGRLLAPALGAIVGDQDLFGRVNIMTSQGRSEYRALQLKLEGRMPRFSYRATYELASASGLGGFISNRGGTYSNDQTNFDAPGEWGPSAADERHRIVLFSVIQLPYAIELSPIFQFATARPYTLTAGRDLNGDGINNDRYLEPATGQKVAVGSERGDHTTLLDVRATRYFGLGGRRQLAVFAELFNVFNTVNFGNAYNGNALSSAFRQPNGLAVGLGEPFRAQFGARFLF